MINNARTTSTVVAVASIALCALALGVDEANASELRKPDLGPDFDADGFGDLAIGVPEEDIGTVENAGVVQVLYGSLAGLTSAGSQLWSQDSSGITDTAEAFDYFGIAIGWGDFDDDGFDDLAVGVPRESAEESGSGQVHVIYGSAAGLTATGAQVWTQGSAGVPGDPEAADNFGDALLSRDFDGDGDADLVIGTPGEDVGAGEITVLQGSTSGLTSAGSASFTQRGDPREDADTFGSSLAAGDVDGDGHLDLAVGAPNERIGGKQASGAVNLFFGSASGLRNRAQFFEQSIIEVPKNGQRGDRFGESLAIGDLDDDGFGDLAIGVPGDKIHRNSGAGAVDVLYGGPDGLRTVGSEVVSQDSAGIEDEAEPLDEFGTDVLSADLDDDGFGDLVIGVPREGVGGVATAGAIAVVRGSGAGPTGSGDQLWTQDVGAVEDTAEESDFFGRALTRGDFDDNGVPDVAVTVAFEEVDGVASAGAVAVLYTGDEGLTDVGNQLWHQGVSGVADDPEVGDGFGLGLMSR